MNSFFESTLIKSIVLLLIPPKQEDEARTLLINISFYSLLVGFFITASLALFFARQELWVHVFTTGGTAICAIWGLFLIKANRANQAVAIVTGYAYIAALVGVTANRGLDDIGVQAIYPILMIIGVLLNPKALTFYASITLLWLVVSAYLESIGFYQGAEDIYSPLQKGFITGSIFVLMFMILRYVVQNTLVTNNNLIEAKKQADESNRLKSVFLANMSHELRTPLNAIIGYSEGLLEIAADEQNLDQSTVSDVSRIHQSGKSLLVLINDILDLSKIEAEQFEIVTHDFCLNDLHSDLMATVLPMATKNGNKINSIGFEEGVRLVTDRQKLRQILLNLLSNSLKYTKNGNVSVTFSQSADYYAFEVSDNGIGIPEAELPFIFDSFRQADNSLSRAYTGTGLGLAITKRLTELLDGKIEVRSTVNKGSMFKVYISTKPPAALEELSGLAMLETT